MVQEEIKRLIEEIKKLPGISFRTAQKIAYAVLNDEKMRAVFNNVADLSDQIETCRTCGFLRKKGDKCLNCENLEKEICIVATYSDLSAIERTGCFSGSYHILGGLISPLDNILPEDLLIDQLKERILSAQNAESIEVLLALPFSIEGDATALYIKDILDDQNVKLSRIARGLPSGTAPDVLDRKTVLEAFSGKTYF
jgi:recombination protein RecR